VTGQFDDVIGHAGVVALLESELESPAQAYLIVGPPSVGKAALASRFASGLLTPPDGSGEARERVRRLALGATHPDLVVVEPEGAASVGVDQARDVVQRASMAPIESPRTVFLFPEAGTMTEQAANALLKTLEEPSPSAVFILVAESEDDFPPTVASRCRTVQVGRVPLEEIVEGLVSRGLDRDVATGVGVVSGGRPGLALALMTRPEVAGFRDLWLSLPTHVTPRPGDGQRLAAEVLAALAPLVDDSVPDEIGRDQAQRARRRVELSLLVSGLEILASWYADSASLQMGGPVRNQDVDLASLTSVSPRRAVHNAELVLDAVVDVQANLRRELVLANLFAALGSVD
jgi:DNA polymerase-3 subunit delta'